MAGFISDEEMEKLAPSRPGFISDEDMAAQEKVSNPLEAGVMGIAQGASAGFLDELSGGVEAAGKAVGLKGLGGSFSDIEVDDDGPSLDWETLRDAYRAGRDKKRGTLSKVREENPGSMMAGEFVGGIVSPANKAVKGLSAAKAGMALGGLNGLGASESESLGGMALDTGLGLTIGGALGKGVEKALPMIQSGAGKAGDGLKEFAEKRAFKALGGGKRATDEALAKGNLQEIGRDMLDSGVVTMGASKEKMAGRVSDLIGQRTSQLDEVLQTVASGGTPEQQAILEQAKFVPKEAAEALKAKIRGQFSELPEEVIAPRLKLVDEWLSSGNPLDIKQAQNFKTQMQKFINDKSYWQNNPSASQETLTGVRRSIKEGIEKNADAFADVTGQNTSGIGNINKGIGRALEADDILQDRISRDATNRSMSLTDYLMAVGGASLGEPASIVGMFKGAAAAGANKVGREYGNNVMAVGADKISRALMRSPELARAASENPKVFQAMVSRLGAHAGPEASGAMGFPRSAEQNDSAENFRPTDKEQVLNRVRGSKYEQALQSAAQKGDASYNAAHFVLRQRDSEYRKLLGADE